MESAAATTPTNSSTKPRPLRDRSGDEGRDAAEAWYLKQLLAAADEASLPLDTLRGWVGAQRASGVLAPGAAGWRLRAAAATIKTDLAAVADGSEFRGRRGGQ